MFFVFILDVYSRMIVGWQLAGHLRPDVVIELVEDLDLLARGQRPARDVHLPELVGQLGAEADPG